jgi:hypothetical protein
MTRPRFGGANFGWDDQSIRVLQKPASGSPQGRWYYLHRAARFLATFRRKIGVFGIVAKEAGKARAAGGWAAALVGA